MRFRIILDLWPFLQDWYSYYKHWIAAFIGTENTTLWEKPDQHLIKTHCNDNKFYNCWWPNNVSNLLFKVNYALAKKSHVFIYIDGYDLLMKHLLVIPNSNVKIASGIYASTTETLAVSKSNMWQHLAQNNSKWVHTALCMQTNECAVFLIKREAYRGIISTTPPIEKVPPITFN